LRLFSFTFLCLSALLVLPSALLAFIPQQPASKDAAQLPPVIKQAPSLKASAYYHFSMGHLYEELAGTYGNRNDYVNKAIENFRLAMKEDPNASFLVEDIAELYRMSGRIREAVEEAQNAINANPNDLNARRVLARIYTQQMGDAQANKVDESMVKRAVEQYKIITEKDPKDIDSLVMLGRLDRVLNDTVDAEAAFKQALAAEPDNEDAITGLAAVYSDRGDAKTASALMEKLTAKNPSPRSFVLLANDYEAMHEFALAVNAYQKALALDPARTELKAALAQDQALAGKLDDALATYQDLASSNPSDAQPYLGMSQIYREKRDFIKAREMNDKALSLDPDNLEIQYNEVGLFEDEGKTPEAIKALKNVLSKTERHTYDPAQKSYRSKMLEQLGLLYRNNEQYPESVETFRQIEVLDPDLTARAEAQVIDTYRIAHEYAKADQTSDAALKKYPNDRTLREVHAQLLSDEEKPDQAIADLKKLLDGKNDREVYLAMADSYQKAKNFQGMSAVLDQADKLSKTTEDKDSVLFLRGAMYEREKKYDPAEKAFRRVLADDPKNASAMNYLGYMLADRGERLTEAQDLINQAVTLDPNNYAFLDSLGWVYYRENKLQDAEQQLRRSVQLMSKDPTIHDHLGDVYFKQGKLREAIAQWESSLNNWQTSAPADVEPEEIAKVQKKLDTAKVRLAQEQKPN
jgi:tetratricopeptide (TPR) repeat protein